MAHRVRRKVVRCACLVLLLAVGLVASVLLRLWALLPPRHQMVRFVPSPFFSGRQLYPGPDGTSLLLYFGECTASMEAGGREDAVEVRPVVYASDGDRHIVSGRFCLGEAGLGELRVYSVRPPAAAGVFPLVVRSENRLYWAVEYWRGFRLMRAERQGQGWRDVAAWSNAGETFESLRGRPPAYLETLWESLGSVNVVDPAESAFHRPER